MLRGKNAVEIANLIKQQFKNDIKSPENVRLAAGNDSDYDENEWEDLVNEDTQKKVRSALKKLVDQTEVIVPLTEMLRNAQGNRICKYICQRLHAIMSANPSKKEEFRAEMGLYVCFTLIQHNDDAYSKEAKEIVEMYSDDVKGFYSMNQNEAIRRLEQ